MIPSRAEIESGIRSVAREHLSAVPALHPSTRLVEDLDLDSLELLTLSFEIENHFDVILEPGVETSIVTVGDLADVIEDLLREAHGNAADDVAHEDHDRDRSAEAHP
jgi:acyl carrier protein